ncbi:MAG: hypothetical protein AAF810_21710 [Cyanobacteria bacterium P01_D01_bin.36]
MTQFTARHRSKLEALWQQPAAQHQAFSEPSIADAICQFGKDVLAFFTGTQQLRIWTKSTKQGVVWFAYDPISDQRSGSCSEEELRIWLESRHQR